MSELENGRVLVLMQQHAVLVLDVGMKGLWVKFKVKQWIERWERILEEKREEMRGRKEDGRAVIIWNDASKWESEQSDWTNKLLYFFPFSTLIFPSTNMTFSSPWKCYVTIYKPTFFSYNSFSFAILTFSLLLFFLCFQLSSCFSSLCLSTDRFHLFFLPSS